MKKLCSHFVRWVDGLCDGLALFGPLLTNEKETSTVDSITIAPRPTTHNKLQYSKSFELYSDSLLVGIASGNVLAGVISDSLYNINNLITYHTMPAIMRTSDGRHTARAQPFMEIYFIGLI